MDRRSETGRKRDCIYASLPRYLPTAPLCQVSELGSSSCPSPCPKTLFPLGSGHTMPSICPFGPGTGNHFLCAQSLTNGVQLYAAPWTLWSTRLLCPWNFPGKNARVACHILLQAIFLTQGSNWVLLSLLHWQADSLPLVPPLVGFYSLYLLIYIHYH